MLASSSAVIPTCQAAATLLFTVGRCRLGARARAGYSGLDVFSGMILAFDTCLHSCSVAVGEASTVRAERHRAMLRGHAEALLPMIAQTLDAAELVPSDLERLAVTVGPGSFTGLRVGVAAARGLALALEVPAGGFSSLELLAAEARAVRPNTPVLAVIPARGDCLYHQAFDAAGDSEAPPRLSTTADAIAAYAGRNGVVIGNGTETIARSLHGLIPLGGIGETPAASLLRLAASSDSDRWTERPAPLYLRPPDARRPLQVPSAPGDG